MKRLALIALLLSACIAPSSGSPTASPRSSTEPPAQIATAGTSRTVSFSDCDARTIPGSLPACELLQAALGHDVFVGVLRRSSAAGFTYEARAIDLQSGETRVLRQLEETELVIEDVRDAVVLLRETEDLGGGDAHVSLLRVPWRDPAHAETLDELDLTGLRGGDTWNPWPRAKTNGRDVVWLHAGGLFGPHEIILLGSNGPRRTVVTTDKPAYFDLDDSGRVAVAMFGADRATQDLNVYDGRSRQLGSRSADAAGYVLSFADTVGWVRGFGMERPPTEVELVPIGGGRSRAARAESGCVVIGATAREVATVCSSGVRLIDVAGGAIRDGPPGRIALAFRGGVPWRAAAGLAADPQGLRGGLLPAGPPRRRGGRAAPPAAPPLVLAPPPRGALLC